MVVSVVKNAGVTVCRGRRVKRRRVSKNNSLAAQQARKEERKREAKRSLKVDPAKFSEFKEKLIAGDLDEKLMDLMKEHNDRQTKGKPKENIKALTNEEIDRQIIQHKNVFKHDAQRIDKAVEGVIQENEIRRTEAVSTRPEELGVSDSKKKDVGYKVASVLANGSEHQGLRYGPTHYAEEDEEAEMLRMLQNRDHIRFNMSI
jgi:hypothetical protein